MKWISTFLLCVLLGAGARLQAQEEFPPQYGYLLERITIPVGSSTLSFPPATRVVIESETETGKVSASISGHVLALKSTQITRDSLVAQALLSNTAQDKKGRRTGKATAALPKGEGTADATSHEKLLALQQQDIQLQDQMDRAFTALQNSPHKSRPRSQTDYANNARHDELKKRWEDLKRQHDKIVEQERQLKREMK